MRQLLQLVAVQPVHEPAVPAKGVNSPSLFLENEANRDNIRLVACLHLGHVAFSLDLLMGSSSSK